MHPCNRGDRKVENRLPSEHTTRGETDETSCDGRRGARVDADGRRRRGRRQPGGRWRGDQGACAVRPAGRAAVRRWGQGGLVLEHAGGRATSISPHAATTRTSGPTRVTPTSGSGASPTGRRATPASARPTRRLAVPRSSTRAVPSQAKWVSRLVNPVGTSIEDVVVFTARYGAYAGRDIAVGGIQYCGSDRHDIAAERGLMLWDVTHPRDAVQIGYLKTACCTRGVHELEVQHRDRPRTDVRLRERAGESLPRRGHDHRRSRRQRRRRLPALRHHEPDGADAGVRVGDPGRRRPVRRDRVAMPTGTTATAPSRLPTGSSCSSPTGTAASSRST